MKKDTHPENHPVCFLDVSNGTEFLATSTMKSKETKTINGVDYFVIKRDISSASHPAFTGEKRFVDTAGRVQKFEDKFRRRR